MIAERERLFEAERGRLFGVAYRMLGSAAEAEDVVQDAWVRWSTSASGAASSIEEPRAFLTTIIVRLSLDHLKSARKRREAYIGPWLPEPLVGDVTSPDARTELAESLSLAFLVMLERLSPLERAAFLLREVFDHPYAEVAGILETTEAACRQLVVRARAHVDENRPRFAATDEKKNELLQAFLAACVANDESALGRLLVTDAVAQSDGGGKVHAALRPILGRDRVTRFILGIMKKYPPDGVPNLVRINGEPGILVRTQRGVDTALVLSTDGDRITHVWIVSNPDKLTRCGTRS